MTGHIPFPKRIPFMNLHNDRGLEDCYETAQQSARLIRKSYAQHMAMAMPMGNGDSWQNDEWHTRQQALLKRRQVAEKIAARLLRNIGHPPHQGHGIPAVVV